LGKFDLAVWEQGSGLGNKGQEQGSGLEKQGSEKQGSGLEISVFYPVDHLADRRVMNAESLRNLIQGEAMFFVR
jgi:hypothetical protein